MGYESFSCSTQGRLKNIAMYPMTRTNITTNADHNREGITHGVTIQEAVRSKGTFPNPDLSGQRPTTTEERHSAPAGSSDESDTEELTKWSASYFR